MQSIYYLYFTLKNTTFLKDNTILLITNIKNIIYSKKIY